MNDKPWTRGTTVTIVACALAASSCVIFGFRPESPDPVVWVDAAEHNFGEISGGETVSHVFTIRNMGGKPLNIARVQTSCGCTVTTMPLGTSSPPPPSMVSPL